jgi:pimeloyl-ACP methyl ester carboxylesterase
LIAPFWKLAPWWQKAIGLLFRPFFKSFKPFGGSDLSNRQIKRAVTKFVDGLDLDNPETMAVMKDLEVPVKLIEEITLTGMNAHKAAREIDIPTLIVQGIHDPRVAIKTTRNLRKQFQDRPWYLEVNAGHNLMSTNQNSWEMMSGSILKFAETELDLLQEAPN